jgi:hypothetical protein
MNRVAWIISVSALLAGLALYAWGREGHRNAASEQIKREAIATQLEDTQAALEAAKLVEDLRLAVETSRVTTAATLQTHAAKADKELTHAIKSNNDWAAEPVPDSVWDAITAPVPGVPPNPAKPAG